MFWDCHDSSVSLTDKIYWELFNCSTDADVESCFLNLFILFTRSEWRSFHPAGAPPAGHTVCCSKCCSYCSYLSHKHPSNYNRLIDIKINIIDNKIQSLQNWVIPGCQAIFDSTSIYKEEKLFERTVHRVATQSQKYYSMNHELMAELVNLRN